jgi:hypothetical protein
MQALIVFSRPRSAVNAGLRRGGARRPSSNSLLSLVPGTCWWSRASSWIVPRTTTNYREIARRYFQGPSQAASQAGRCGSLVHSPRRRVSRSRSRFLRLPLRRSTGKKPSNFMIGRLAARTLDVLTRRLAAVLHRRSRPSGRLDRQPECVPVAKAERPRKRPLPGRRTVSSSTRTRPPASAWPSGAFSSRVGDEAAWAFTATGRSRSRGRSLWHSAPSRPSAGWANGFRPSTGRARRHPAFMRVAMRGPTHSGVRSRRRSAKVRTVRPDP